jgi:pyruvate carboxylase
MSCGVLSVFYWHCSVGESCSLCFTNMPSPSRVSQEQGKRRIRKICNFLTPEPCATPIFKKLLVVNRGEIARRIMRGAKSLGIPTVAIYAAADADALHRETADEAFEVKAPAGKEADAIAPYLNIDEVMRVAKESGADAAHPGYGFLAESEAFAAACAANGVKFVGPDSKTIGLFGDKTMARALAIEHGVSVAAGSGPIQSAEEAIKFIEDNKVPYPVLVKAAFGGGGRGQRLVHQGSELAAALDSCVKEAEMAFGDGTCFIEEFVSPGRHIEIQVLGDGPGGNAIHLFERDCSVQLRNQKVTSTRLLLHGQSLLP